MRQAVSTGRTRGTEDIEMNIAFKEEYLKSEKDMEDAQYQKAREFMQRLRQESNGDQKVQRILALRRKI